MIRKLAALTASTSLLALSAMAQDIAIQNATLFDGDAVREGATLVIRDGRVVSWSTEDALPSGVEVIDAENAWVTPGIFAAYSQAGIVEVGAEDSTNDTSAPMSGFGASLDMSDAFNPASTVIEVTRIEGVTRMAVAPSLGASMFGGQGFIASTTGEPGSIAEERAFSLINLGEGGAGISGGSRPAAWATLRAALGDARAYPARYIASQEGDVLDRLDAQAFARVARELGRAYPELGDEFTLTAIELGFLTERRQAFENLATRVNLDAVKGVVTTMIQTEKYGTPLASALRVLSAEFRNERMMRAEEKAARLPAIMTVPLILFILPTLFVVILGPAACSISDAF